jgi:hypothetical protein
MTKLINTDVVNLEVLKDRFQYCVYNVDYILKQKDTDDIDSNLANFEWLLRDELRKIHHLMDIKMNLFFDKMEKN